MPADFDHGFTTSHRRVDASESPFKQDSMPDPSLTTTIEVDRSPHDVFDAINDPRA
jgi:hypothetical protein